MHKQHIYAKLSWQAAGINIHIVIAKINRNLAAVETNCEDYIGMSSFQWKLYIRVRK